LLQNFPQDFGVRALSKSNLVAYHYQAPDMQPAERARLLQRRVLLTRDGRLSSPSLHAES
jgi:hypothetical protein